MHENSFCVHETVSVHEKKTETCTRYSWVSDEEQKKVTGVFFENFAADIMRKLYIGVHSFFLFFSLGCTDFV